MGGHRDATPVGGRRQVEHATEAARGEPLRAGAGRRAVGRAHLQRVLALGVAHPDDPSAVAEHPRQAGPHTGLRGEGPAGARAGGEPVQRAADLDRTGPAGAVRHRGRQLLGHVDDQLPPPGR